MTRRRKSRIRVDENTIPSEATVELRAWFGARWIALRFLAVFGLLLGVFYAVILLPVCNRAFYSCLCLNAQLGNAILHLLGQATTVSDVTIRSAVYSVSIRRGCDAIEPAWFFCAAVMAFPGRWRRKPAGLAIGVVAILGLNLVRVVSLYFIGLRFPQFFQAAHLEIWPTIFILAALCLWAAWIRWSNVVEPTHAQA